jgi:hypothetical protein
VKRRLALYPQAVPWLIQYGIIAQLFLKVNSFLQKSKNIFDFYKKITETLRNYRQTILQKSKI